MVRRNVDEQFDYRVPTNSARTDQTTIIIPSRLPRMKTKYIDGTILGRPDHSTPSRLNFFPKSRPIKNSRVPTVSEIDWFHQYFIFDRFQIINYQSISLMPVENFSKLDKFDEDDDDENTSLTLPSIVPKKQFNEEDSQEWKTSFTTNSSFDNKHPWIRRYKSIHRAQQMAELLRYQRTDGHRIQRRNQISIDEFSNSLKNFGSMNLWMDDSWHVDEHVCFVRPSFNCDVSYILIEDISLDMKCYKKWNSTWW